MYMEFSMWLLKRKDERERKIGTSWKEIDEH